MLAVALLTAGLLGPAQAQEKYPARPIKVVVPLTPGSPVDVVARLVGQQWSGVLGQPVIIENRPGAGATIGAKSVAVADPDGYTLLLTAANHVIAPSAYKNLTYDPIKDFAPLGSVAVMPFVIVIANSVPANTVPELVAYARANPGKLNFGFGLGTSPHLLGELFKLTTQTNIASIPYKGGAQAVTDILAGQIHMNIGTTATMVHVPVFYGYCESVNIETERKITVAKARELLKNAPGVKLMDNPANEVYPMPIDAAGQDLALVGRIREDESIENGLNLWIVADNIRKGAATNAVQIAEILVEKYLK